MNRKVAGGRNSAAPIELEALSSSAPLGPDAFAALFGPAFADVPPGATVLAAVSGGPDSVALMGGLADWAATGRIRVAVATVDHRLRVGASREAAGVAAACASLGLPHHVLTWLHDRVCETGQAPQTPLASQSPRASQASQASARTARYALLAAHAKAVGAACLVTAHTADDQAETILMRLAAGSGIAGLAGMVVRSRQGGVPHVRPLLSVPKAALVATCRAQGWVFVEDPSNRDPRYARTRWRRLLPGLAEEGLDPARLARFAARAARADEALDAVAADVFARHAVVGPDGVALDGAELSIVPSEVALRVLARALAVRRAPGRPPTRLERLESCLAALLDAVAAGRACRRTLAGCLIEARPGGHIRIAPEPPRRRGRPEQAARGVHDTEDRPRA